MVDLETMLQPVFDDSPEPEPFAVVRRRATVVRRRRVVRIVGASVAVVALVAGSVAFLVHDRHDTVTVVAPTPTPAPAPLQLGTPTRLPGWAMDMIYAYGSVWVTRAEKVARLDPVSGRVLATIPVPGSSDYRNIEAGSGSIWVDETATETVTRIDPTSNRVTASISLRHSSLVTDGIAFLDGKLWVARPEPEDDSRGDVVAIDPATNEVAAQATIPRTFGFMSGGTHALWYVREPNLIRFDTTTLKTTVVRRDVTAVLTSAGGHLWLITEAGVVEVDEATGAQIGEPFAVAGPVNITVTVSAGIVWIGSQPDSSTAGSVTPYDITTHRPLAAPVRVGLPILTMTAVPNALWVDADALTRIPYSR